MHTTSKGFLVQCHNSEKDNDPIPRKHSDREQDKRMDRTLLAIVRGSTSTTAVHWHLKVKDIE